MRLRNLLTLALAFTLSVTAQAARIGDDTLIVGKPNSVTNKTIKAGGGFLRYDMGASKWKFSNDGTNSKDFGSGNGGAGGVEMLADNAEFESGVTSFWTASAPSTITALTGSNALFDTTSFSFIPTGSGQTYTSAQYSIPKGLQGGPCLATIYYTSAEATNLITMTVIDGSSAAISPVVPFSRNVGAAAPLHVPFTCPTSGTAAIKLTSSGVAVALKGDKAHLGSETRIREISQASMWAYADIPSASGCEWASNTNASFASFAADSDCSFPAGGNLAGNAAAAATKIPAFQMTSVPAGDYEVSVSGAFLKNSSGGACSYALYDGTTRIAAGSLYGSGSQSGNLTLVGRFSYASDQSPKTIEIQATGNGGAADCRIENDSAVENLTFTVKRFPSASQTVTQGTGQAAYYSGLLSGPSWTTSSNSFVDGTPTGSATLIQNENINFGSVVQTPSVAGLNLSFPKLGGYEICFHTDYSNSNAGDATYLQLTDGATVFGRGSGYGGSTSPTPISVCGIYRATSLGLTTIKMQGRVSNANGVWAGGEGIIQITIKQLDAGQAAVAYPGIVSSASSGQVNIASAVVLTTCSSDPCTIDRGFGISAINWNSTGSYDVHFSPGTFSAAPACTFTGKNSIVSPVIVSTPTSSVIEVEMRGLASSGATSLDSGMMVNCIGPK